MFCCLILIIVILVAFYPIKEGFLPCIDCDKKEITPSVVQNPFVWPYSGSTCLNVRQANTPDHPQLE